MRVPSIEQAAKMMLELFGSDAEEVAIRRAEAIQKRGEITLAEDWKRIACLLGSIQEEDNKFHN